MNDYSREDWPYTTYFEDVILPGHALSLDAATQYDHLPEHDEVESVWFFHFACCVGIPHNDDARIVLVHSMNLLAKLLRHEEFTISRRREIVPDEDPYVVYNEWTESLRTMIDASRGKKYCFWIAGYQSDADYLKEVRRRALLPVAHQEYNPPPHIRELEVTLESSLASATTALSKAERIYQARANKRRKAARRANQAL